MRLEGWNHIPDGYGARFDVPSAPLWIRVLFHTPVLDRFAYPALVRRGHGYLLPPADTSAQDLGMVTPGWRVDPAGYEPPGSSVRLTWGG